MKLCIIGIGGCGGKLTAKLLENQDTTLIRKSLGNYVCFGGVKGMWLEADVQETSNQDFFRPLDITRDALNTSHDPYISSNFVIRVVESLQQYSKSSQDTYYPFFCIPHDILQSESRTSQLMQMKYGFDLKKQGYFRQAEFLKAIFEIFNIDMDIRKIAREETGFENPILGCAWNNIRPYTTLAGSSSKSKSSDLCDGILFIVSLGGGTGTGFINPLTSYIRQERSEYPVFVLGVLTEKGRDNQQNAEEPKRDLSASISMQDLLTRARGQGIDGLILIDNQILKDLFGGDYTIIDRFICQSLKPILAARHYPGENPPSLAIRELFLESQYMPPILIPCYSRDRSGTPIKKIASNALTQGKLFGCEPINADMVYIFARGFIDAKNLCEFVSEQVGLSSEKVVCWRKMGDNVTDEVLILLRNPYGSYSAFKKEGTLEHRLHNILINSIEYIDKYRNEILQAGRTERTNLSLEAYFYGERGLKYNLKEALSRIENGEKPIFQNSLNVFETLDAQYTSEAADYSEGNLVEGQVREIVEHILKEKGLVE